MGQLKELTDEYGIELKAKLNDPIFFVEEVLFKPRGWILPPYAKEWLHLCNTNKRVNLTAFRSSSKTEVVLISQAVWRAFKQANFDGIITSNSLKQSTEVLKRIRDVILENEILRGALDNSKFKEQNKTTISLKNGARIRCLPYNNNIRMNHVNWIGADEIGLYRDHDLMKSAVSPAVTAKAGDINCVGTPMSKIDLIHKLRENEAYTSRIYPAWTKDVNLFKQRYPDRKVIKKDGKYQIILKNGTILEVYDSLTWSREFMCVPLGSEDRLFPYELIEQSFDYNIKMSKGVNTNSKYFVGVDFAMSAESSADFTVVIILERTKEGKIILADMQRWKGLSYNSQKIRIAELLNYYRPIRAVLDESSFGASFLDDLRRMVKGVGIQGFKFSYGPYTNKKQELITMLRTSFEANWEVFNTNEKTPLEDAKKNFIIPAERTCTRTTKLNKDITNELLGFGMKYDEKTHNVKFEGIGTHDDIVVALALANFASHGHLGLKPILSRGSAGYNRLIVGKTR